jgi:hypothetical protein
MTAPALAEARHALDETRIAPRPTPAAWLEWATAVTEPDTPGIL